MICSFLFFIHFHYASEAALSTEDTITDKYSSDLSLFIQPLHFISRICQQKRQYSLKISENICSRYFQSYTLHDKEQRQKHVGWTIIV
ncbi:unnamed protein product [Rotaria sp. Silwood1]|nr:unnamed protein product [Rotaria sp. Silwood1]